MTSIEKLIAEVNRADSADSLLEAVENLAEAGSVIAIPTLIEVLGFNNPGAAVAAVEGLIRIGESAVPHLLATLDTYNYGARAWTIRAFAGIGDPAALDLLLKAAVSDFSQSVRRAAARGLGIIRWSKLPPEEVSPAQEKVLQTLFLATEDGEWVVRYAAIAGLQSLGESVPDKLLDAIAIKLREILAEETEIVVQARIKLALKQLIIEE